MLKAVIFDLDGVIINSEPIYYEANQQLFNQLSINVSEEEYQRFIGKTGKDVWSYLKSKHNIDIPLGELILMENEYFIRLLRSRSDIQPMRGIVKFINSLLRDGISIAVASSSVRMSIDAVLKRFGLDRLFNTVVSGEDVLNGKPSPDIFVITAERLGVKSSECIVIEDSYNGVKASNTAKMFCIGYKTNAHLANQDLSLADMVIDDFTKLSLSDLRMLFN